MHEAGLVIQKDDQQDGHREEMQMKPGQPINPHIPAKPFIAAGTYRQEKNPKNMQSQDQKKTPYFNPMTLAARTYQTQY